MALNASEQAYAAELATRTGMPLSVAQLWVQAEGGGAGANNWLNIMPGGQGISYATPQAGADAAAQLISSSPAYSGIRGAISTGDPVNILRAIVASPWDGTNHYAGTSFGAYVASLTGGSVNGVTLPGSATESSGGVVSIDSNTPTTGCLIPKPGVLGGGCLLSYSSARKIGGVGAMVGGGIVMGLGMWMIVGGTAQPPIERYLRFVARSQQRAPGGSTIRRAKPRPAPTGPEASEPRPAPGPAPEDELAARRRQREERQTA